ncbi:hypothetical protein [Streptomyces sp. NPDC096132]|uniref:hypothetical protein n=1 Tax=Streptomyces sp. NPDC096132 TaxID=3366075 RepID=UPI0037F6BE4F
MCHPGWTRALTAAQHLTGPRPGDADDDADDGDAVVPGDTDDRTGTKTAEMPEAPADEERVAALLRRAAG